MTMKRYLTWLFSTARGRLSLAIGVPLALAAWYFSAEPRGIFMADIDYLCGRYGVWETGPPWPWLNEEKDLLRERYRVEVVGLMPDHPTPVTLPLIWYGRGYNTVARANLQEKYGKDVLVECARDARKRWAADHPKEAEKMGIRP
jgi:hypothetical protein